MAKQIKLWVYVASVNATNTLRLRIDQDTNNWGTVVDADINDFQSTNTTLVASLSISSTGWKSFTINESYLDFTKTLWVRLHGDGEGDYNVRAININSQNATSNRPYLEIIDSGGAPQRSATGAGQ